MAKLEALEWYWDEAITAEDSVSTNAAELNRFLASVEKRAFRMAEIAVGDREEALDLVQDAMCKLAEKYAARPSDEWGPLFHRILQSRIRDWYRRSKVRKRLFGWLPATSAAETDVAEVQDQACVEPLRQLESENFGPALIAALQQLPIRQRQVFLLRVWEGLDVKQTAAAVGCAEGSVKTHHFRAIKALRRILSEYDSD